MHNDISMPQSIPFLLSVHIVIRRKNYSIKAKQTYLK